MARVFVSYSHHDRRWVDRADRHTLIPFLADSLKRDEVEIWYDHALVPGDVFRAAIEEKIDRADLAILLVSQHFLNSDFIRDVELPRIERRAATGELRVLPILVGPCEWQELKIVGDRHLVPGGPRPLIEFVDRDADWARVQHEILQALKKQIGRASVTGPASPTPEVVRRPRTPLGDTPRPWRPRAPVVVIVGIAVVAVVVAFALRSRWVASDPHAARQSVASSASARPALTAEELKTLETEVAGYRQEIRGLPFAASARQADLQRLAQRLWQERSIGPDAARAAATTYRLYAASILMSPTGSTLAGIQSAAPWVRRAVELYPGFADRPELDEANRFLMDLLIKQPAQIEMKALLAREIRIAMVEAGQAEVDRQVETAFGMIKTLMEHRKP